MKDFKNTNEKTTEELLQELRESQGEGDALLEINTDGSSRITTGEIDETQIDEDVNLSRKEYKEKYCQIELVEEFLNTLKRQEELKTLYSHQQLMASSIEAFDIFFKERQEKLNKEKK